MCRRRAATWSIKVGMESHATASCRKSTDAALVAGRCLPPRVPSAGGEQQPSSSGAGPPAGLIS